MINKIDNKKSAYNVGVPIATTAAGAATGYSLYRYYSYPSVVQGLKENRNKVNEFCDEILKKHNNSEYAKQQVKSLKQSAIRIVQSCRIKLEIVRVKYPIVGAIVGLVIGGIGVLANHIYKNKTNAKNKNENI